MASILFGVVLLLERQAAIRMDKIAKQLTVVMMGKEVVNQLKDSCNPQLRLK